MVQRKVFSFWKLLLILRTFAALESTEAYATEMVQTNVVVLRDCTSNVDYHDKLQMVDLEKNIKKMLTGDSHLYSGCIADKIEKDFSSINKEFPEEKISICKESHEVVAINADTLKITLNSNFPFVKYRTYADIFILLVDEKTKLDGTLPDIVRLKKTLIICFGTDKCKNWKNVATNDNLFFQMKAVEDSQNVMENVKKQLFIESQSVCDLNKYCTSAPPCQCVNCNHICNFVNVSDSCLQSQCKDHPLLRDTNSVESSTQQNYVEKDEGNHNQIQKVVIIVVAVVTVILSVIIVIYICWKHGMLRFPQQQDQPGFPEPQDQPGFPQQQNQPGFPQQQNQPGFPEPQEQPGFPEPQDQPGFPEPQDQPGFPQQQNQPGLPQQQNQPGLPQHNGQPRFPQQQHDQPGFPQQPVQQRQAINNVDPQQESESGSPGNGEDGPGVDQRVGEDDLEREPLIKNGKQLMQNMDAIGTIPIHERCQH